MFWKMLESGEDVEGKKWWGRRGCVTCLVSSFLILREKILVCITSYGGTWMKGEEESV